MYNIGVIYSPYGSETDELVKEIAKTVEIEKHNCRLRKSGEASIVDLAASDIIVFVTKSDGGKKLDEDYSEIVRALQGINLSGRIAGVVSLDGEKTELLVRSIFADTGITFSRVGSSLNKKNAGAWIKKIIKEYQEMMNERGFE